MIHHSLSVVLNKIYYANFIRIHRSFVINIFYIETFNDHAIYLHKQKLPLGRSYKDHFFRQFSFL